MGDFGRQHAYLLDEVGTVVAQLPWSLFCEIVISGLWLLDYTCDCGTVQYFKDNSVLVV